MMKKTAPLIGLLFLACSILRGQDAAPTLVVMECQGKIKYYPSQKSKPVDVAAGMLISPDGVLKAKKGASMQVLNRNQVVPAGLPAKGSVAVKDAIPAPPTGGRFGLGGNFLEMVNKTIVVSAPTAGAAMNAKGAGGDEPPPPTTTRKGAGGDEPPPPSSTKKGAGEGLMMASWNFPVKGKIFVRGPINFSWEGYFRVDGPWEFSISEFGNEENLYKAETIEPTHSINTLQAKLALGKSYVWRVKPASRKDAGKAFAFSPVQENAEKGVMEVVEMEPDYGKAGPVQKLLWEAFAYEEAQFLTKADALYKQALKLEPGNQLAIQLYKAFWSRNW